MGHLLYLKIKIMKIKLLAISLFFCGLSQAQFTFSRTDGTPITNGSVVTFGSSGNSSKLNFRLTNTSNVPLDIKIKCTSLVNAPGTSFELCYAGTCNDFVVLNGVYPDYENLLNPGQSNPPVGEHFVNYNAGNGQIQEYGFSVYALGFEQNAINFVYRFDPNLFSTTGFDALQNLGITLNSTRINDMLSFDSQVNGNLSIVSVTGQEVIRTSFSEGNQNINTTSLASGLYIAQFKTNTGETGTIKIIKN